MTSETLSAIVGVILSLGFSYIPGLNTWYSGLEKEQKQLLMGGLLVVTAVAIFALSCASLLTSVACTKEGALGLVQVLVAALVTNQSTYLLTRK